MTDLLCQMLFRLVTANTFGMLGARAMIGRVFTENDSKGGAPGTVAPSDNSWRDRYSSDTSLVGRTIYVDGIARSVIGVMPQGLRCPANEDAWLPLIMPVTTAENAHTAAFDVFGMLRDNGSRQAAVCEFAVIADRMA
jgi:hypothetical protein